MPFEFRCPQCRRGLQVQRRDGVLHCARCGQLVGGEDGILDFVSHPARRAERKYYDAEYASSHWSGRPVRSPEALVGRWTAPRATLRRAVWESVGDLEGRRVVLLGAGASAQELSFLTLRPEVLVYSDLSVVGIRNLRERCRFAIDPEVLRFAAIDALDLPFDDESVDVVYGSEFVHHVPDVPAFIREVARVLRPGGHTVFADAGYSPLWQLSKRTWLYPLMRCAHRRYPISPEDLRATMAGGFREAELAAVIRDAGAEPWFRRVNLLFYLWSRGAEKLLPRALVGRAHEAPLVDRLIAVDEAISRRPRGRTHLIDLVWGLRKPQSAA